MTEYLHNQVWTRFVRMPYGHVLDYADENGNTIIPTAEECKKGMPNPFGWYTPIANGAFFTGLYAYALLEKHSKTNDEKTAEEINILINGLKLLQDVGHIEGFIARGVSSDGSAYHPFSSEDQLVPWAFALYRYYKSDLCRDKEDIKSRLIRALTAIRDCGWKIPCDIEGVYTNGWLSVTDWRSVTKMLYCARIIYELTDDAKDLDLFNLLAEGKPEGCIFTRLEIISHGFAPDMVAFLGNKFWICTCAHMAARELLFADSAHADFYKRGLLNNGITSYLHIDNILKYDNSPTGFNCNWRELNRFCSDGELSIENGMKTGELQGPFLIKNIAPHRAAEDALGAALFASWIAVTCEDKNIYTSAIAKLKRNLPHVDWNTCRMSFAFAAESALIFE